MEAERIDTRKLEPAAREQLRRPTVTLWLLKAEAGHGVKEAQCGRPEGNGRRLTPAQESVLQKDLVDQTPDQVSTLCLMERAGGAGAYKDLFWRESPGALGQKLSEALGIHAAAPAQTRL